MGGGAPREAKRETVQVECPHCHTMLTIAPRYGVTFPCAACGGLLKVEAPK